MMELRCHLRYISVRQCSPFQQKWPIQNNFGCSLDYFSLTARILLILLPYMDNPL